MILGFLATASAAFEGKYPPRFRRPLVLDATGSLASPVLLFFTSSTNFNRQRLARPSSKCVKLVTFMLMCRHDISCLSPFGTNVVRGCAKTVKSASSSLRVMDIIIMGRTLIQNQRRMGPVWYFTVSICCIPKETGDPNVEAGMRTADAATNGKRRTLLIARNPNTNLSTAIYTFWE